MQEEGEALEIVSMAELSYDQLREVQKRERSTAMLSELPEDFYASAGAFVSKLKTEVSSGFSIENAREYENALKVVRDIYSVREQKILVRSIRAARGSNNVTGLASVEMKVFSRAMNAVSDGEKEFESLLGGMEPVRDENASSESASAPAPVQAQAPPENGGAGKKIRILAPIPQFVGADGGKHGPFKPGEIVFLPEKEAAMILKRKLADLG